MRSAFVTSAFIVLAASVLTQPVRAQSPSYHWTQYVDGGFEARVITVDATCPVADIDGRKVPMQLRAASVPVQPVNVCAVRVPASARSLRIDGAALALPPPAPKRVAVVGDTGCRIKGGYLQACNDPAQWPFRQVAASIAAMKPDLIIHVGDYHYRETPCPVGNAGCAGSPFGDTWDVWREDFFSATGPLLAAAPWVFVRGNHEECVRAGLGWTRMLAPANPPADGSCQAADAPFLVRLPALSLAVMDVAAASEPTVDAPQAATFRAQYAAVAAAANGPVWALQHRPIWSIGGTVAGFSFGDNKTLAQAAKDGLPEAIQLIISGHHHIFQALTYVQDLPAQIVVGHGGDTLNPGTSSDPTGWSINGVTIKSGTHTTAQFGFAVIEQQSGGWSITNYDASGAAVESCGLAGRTIRCTKAGG